MKKAKKQARQHSRLPREKKTIVVRCLLLVTRQLENLIYPVHIQASETFSGHEGIVQFFQVSIQKSCSQ